MSKIKLAAAKEFVLAKQYNVARTILEGMPEDETAKKWLAKLNELYPKPKTIEDMTDEELLAIIGQEQAATELLKRIWKIITRYGWGIYREERPYLSNLVSQLCSTLKLKAGNYHETQYIGELLVLILRELCLHQFYQFPGPQELDLIEELLQHPQIEEDASIILTRSAPLRAELAAFSKIYPGLTIKWKLLEGNARSPTPVIQVFKNGDLLFDVKIPAPRATVSGIDFSTELWQEDYPRMAPLIYAVAFDIYDIHVDEVTSELEDQRLLDEALETYETEFAPYLDDYEGDDYNDERYDNEEFDEFEDDWNDEDDDEYEDDLDDEDEPYKDEEDFEDDL